MGALTVRHALPGDVPALAAVEAACFPPEEAASAQSLARRVDTFGQHFYLLFDGGELISFVNGMVTNDADLRDEMYENAALHDENGAWQMIFGVDTVPARRREGHAARLLRRMIADARSQGRRGLVLTCKDHMLRYYARFGFEDEGVTPYSVHGGAVWHQMRLDLSKKEVPMKDIKVLFLGNSHTYFNDMPHLLSEICRQSTGCRADVTMLAYSGRTLAWHRSEYFSLRFALLYGGFDYCFIQQAAHPFPPEEETLPAGAEIARMCRETGVTPVFSMTWAEKRFPENQQKMISAYEKLATDNGALLSPVGRAWQRLLSEHPEIDLFFRDGEHASPYGDLLIAATHAALVAGPDALRLPDHILDFRLSWNDPQRPEASLKREEMLVPLDPAKANAILSIVREALA